MKLASAVASLVGCLLVACQAPEEPSGQPTPSPEPSATPAVAPAPAGAVAPPAPEQASMPAATLAAVSAIGAEAIDGEGREGKSIGLAIGVWTPSYEATLGFGRTRAGGDTVPDGDTVFELGSVSKVFAGMLLADRVLAGRMDLSDATSDYLPGAPLPTFAGQPITLAHLASHGSGLPSMPDNLVGDQTNPAAGYTRELLWDFLSRTELSQAPGTAYRYSNVGIGLLGLALSREANGASFESMVVDTIARPLQMQDTRVDHASYPPARLAQGHRGTTPTPPNQIDVLEAGGALRSTARDMVKLVALHAGTPHPLGPVAALVQAKVLDKAKGGSCGLALEIRPEAGRTYFEKSGSTSGFTARILVTREPALGVVVLANSAGADVNEVAQRLHDAVREGAEGP